jgi:paraquat-inducible protein A
MHLKACHCCGQIHHVPLLAEDQLAICTRCRAPIRDTNVRAANRAAAAAAAALVLYWPAILLPILRIHQFGFHHESSLLGGTIELLRHGNWFVGLVVLLFSIVLPLVKIVLLLELSLVGLMHRHHKALTYRVMESLGKWSMMDVMLLAFMVMLVKLGEMVEFQFGPAVWAFVFCVAMSIIASLLFDPHSIWDEQDG